jgi:nitrite reductase/ring-hydroxylating ferredoxin subunit
LLQSFLLKKYFITEASPRHGWHYDLAGGASTDHPGYTLKTYQVEVVGDDILVDLG